MENQQNNPQLGQEAEENEISLLEILFRYLRYWKWFVVSIVVAVLVAFVYLRYTVPIYNVTSSVILKHEKDSRAAMGGLDMLDGMGMMGGVSSVENETYVIRSKHAVRTVIDKLKLNTSYMVKGRIVQSDMYTKSPFVINPAQPISLFSFSKTYH